MWFVLIILIILGLVAFFFFRVPAKLGYQPSRAAKLLSSTPDREASRAILKEAATKGLSAQGTHLYVFPMKEGNTSIAFALFMGTEGFAFPRIADKDPIIQTLIAIGTAPTTKASNVSVVGFEYYDDKGRSYMTIAARVPDIEKVASGQMTKEEFIKVSYGDVRVDEVISAEIDQMKELISNSQSSQ